MSRPAKTLIFHIGDHKTGSTSIQEAFAQGRVSLKDRSVFYPARLSHNMLKTHCLAFAEDGKPAAQKRATTLLRNLAEKIRQAEADYCLISAEALEGVDADLFHKVVTRFFADAADDIRVVAYVRPHAARILSNFAEQTKIGRFRGGLEPYFRYMLKRKRFHYQPRFSAWRAAFGKNFLLRPMIGDQLVDGSVVHDFIRHGFGETGFQVTGDASANESLCLEDLMRLKVLQLRCARHPQEIRHALGWEFSRAVASLPPCETRTRLALHKTLAEQIRNAYLEDARALDAGFFDGARLLETALDRAVQDAPEEAQSVAPRDHFPPSEIRSLHLLSDIVAGMLEKDGDEWVSFLRSKRIAPSVDRPVAPPSRNDRDQPRSSASTAAPRP